MLEVEDRREEIVRLVSESGHMSVERLARLLDVSTMTIRRDLSYLDEQGELKREHGFARLAGECAYGEKHIAHADEKRRIAKACANLIEPRDTIFLDAGTTTFEIARRIWDIPGLFVITDDIKIAFVLSQCSNFDIMVCGGQIQRETGSIIGVFANQVLGYVQIDKAFMGAASINDQFNVLTPTIEKASLKRLVVANAHESYLAVDHSKFNRRALMKTNNCSEYTGIVTTKQFSPDEKAHIDRLKIHVMPVSRDDATLTQHEEAE